MPGEMSHVDLCSNGGFYCERFSDAVITPCHLYILVSLELLEGIIDECLTTNTHEIGIRSSGFGLFRPGEWEIMSVEFYNTIYLHVALMTFHVDCILQSLSNKVVLPKSHSRRRAFLSLPTHGYDYSFSFIDSATALLILPLPVGCVDCD